MQEIFGVNRKEPDSAYGPLKGVVKQNNFSLENNLHSFFDPIKLSLQSQHCFLCHFHC